MKFNETILYGSISKFWGDFSSMNAYSAFLCSPIFLIGLVFIALIAVIMDCFVAITKLIF